MSGINPLAALKTPYQPGSSSSPWGQAYAGGSFGNIYSNLPTLDPSINDLCFLAMAELWFRKEWAGDALRAGMHFTMKQQRHVDNVFYLVSYMIAAPDINVKTTAEEPKYARLLNLNEWMLLSRSTVAGMTDRNRLISNVKNIDPLYIVVYLSLVTLFVLLPNKSNAQEVFDFVLSHAKGEGLVSSWLGWKSEVKRLASTLCSKERIGTSFWTRMPIIGLVCSDQAWAYVYAMFPVEVLQEAFRKIVFAQ